MSAWFDRARSREFLVLAVPIILGMTSQTVLNLVDTAMVGRLGPTPQAAAGLGSFAFWVLANLVIGIGAGVQATVARRDGEGDREGAGSALDTGLLLAVVIGLPVGWGLSQFAPDIFSKVTDNSEMAIGGGAYLAIRLMGLGAVAANYCFRGFYNGIGQSAVYMSSLLVIHVSNIVMNWIFIYGNLGAAPMGVRGAALASVLAAVFGVCFYSILTLVRANVRTIWRPFRFRNIRLSLIRKMGALSVPEGVRGVLVMLAFFIFLDLHEGRGRSEAAAGVILVNIASVGFLPAMGMGMAGATLVGRHLGRGEPDEARRLVWLGARLAMVLLVIPGVLMFSFCEPILGVFTADQPVIDVAAPALQLFAVTMIFDALPIVVVFSLIGAGATRWVAGVQVIQQYVLLLPLAWLFGVVLGAGVLGMWVALFLSRIGLAVLAIHKLRGDTWTKIEV